MKAMFNVLTAQGTTEQVFATTGKEVYVMNDEGVAIMFKDIANYTAIRFNNIISENLKQYKENKKEATKMNERLLGFKRKFKAEVKAIVKGKKAGVVFVEFAHRQRGNFTIMAYEYMVKNINVGDVRTVDPTRLVRFRKARNTWMIPTK